MDEPEEEKPPANRWVPGMASPNPAGRPKMPRTVKEVRDLCREKTPQMVEVLSRVALNPKSPPAARTAAATEILNRAWGRPASTDLEGAEQLVIKILKLNQADEDMKVVEDARVIEHDDNGESS